ncbi:MAG: RepB family DNA primase [Betaproteobacteria bacterium]|nr:RepB family DNA primase [Betaproteobacteria bacterium]
MQKPDLTYLAARRQLNAMQCGLFEVGIRDGKTERMMSRAWNRNKILSSIAWLKQVNASGMDVYVRAALEGSGLVLLDDLVLDTVERMKRDGFAPAALVETSPANYQAWVRLSENNDLPAPLMTACAKALARQYEGDPASADWHHYGRLAGFTNRKPVHVTADGRHPWVLCHEANGQIAAHGAKLLCEMQNFLLAEEAKPKPAPVIRPRLGNMDAQAEFTRQWKALIVRYGENIDSKHGLNESRADFVICRNLLQDGYTPDEVAAALAAASPNLSTRKKGHEQDYIDRTLLKAWQAVENPASSPLLPGVFQGS